MASSLWLARDSNTGPMQYCMFNRKPRRVRIGFEAGVKGAIRIEVANELAERMAGRKLDILEAIEVVCTEVQE